MKIKECYVSHNGITCFTNINTLVDIKDIKINLIKNNKNINITTFLFYITLRVSEFIIKDFIKNSIYLSDKKFQDNIIEYITFS